MSERAIETAARMARALGTRGWAEAALYPLLTPPYVAWAWLCSLWAARELLRGRWSRYQGFHPLNALTSFFYKTQWLNVERFGRWGISPLVGLGNYPLSRWFHLTLLSSCLYANAGAAATLLGTLAWVLLHLAWLGVAAAGWVAAIMLVLWSSSTAFAMAFTRQNYNILGWLWLPVALFGATTGQWPLALLAWLASSLTSITVVFTAVPLMLALAWQTGSAAPLGALLPAVIKLALHAVPMVMTGDLRGALHNTAKLIGLTSRGTRYRRGSMRLRPFTAYFVAVYAIGCALLWFAYGLPFLPLIALLLFVINQMFLRFADEQSVVVMFVSVFAAHLLAAPPSWLALAAFAVVTNPLPVFFGLCAAERDRTLVRAQVRRPFDHTALQAGMERFLAPVPAGQRVLFAFDDPQDLYENVFDGYRTLIELPLFVAGSRGVLLLPDWYAVAETNYVGAPDCWGRSLAAVRTNTKTWNASHVIVYHDSAEALDPVWASAGFIEVSVFDWGDWLHELEGFALWRSASPPCWRLLTVPDYRP
jgi:hypothetical protein